MNREPEKLLTMVNRDLARAPVRELSPSLRLRWYEPGDEARWVEIQAAADEFNTITPELFGRHFPEDEFRLAERQCFLLDGTGRFIATGSAWGESEGEFAGFGRVHWMAVLPPLQGRGIGTLLMSVICRRLLSLGHTEAFLTTSSYRPAALRLYENFGFTIRPGV